MDQGASVSGWKGGGNDCVPPAWGVAVLYMVMDVYTLSTRGALHVEHEVERTWRGGIALLRISVQSAVSV